MRYRAHGASDVGKVRDHNEDNLVVEIVGDGGVGLFVVADGVGGSRHGEVASAMVVEMLQRWFKKHTPRFSAYSLDRDRELRGDLAATVSEMIEAASAAIYERGQSDPEYHGMSTTIVALVTTSHGAFLGHVGDSRGYLVRDGAIYRLTEDHTFANFMLDAKALEPESLVNHPFAGVLARSVGSAPHVKVDTTFVQVESGDRFILCTDGLHKYLSGRELESFSTREADPELLVHTFIKEALARGGDDNVTAVVVQADGGAETLRTQALREEIQLLQNTFLFEQLSDQEVMRLMRIMFTVRHRAGEVIIHEETRGHELYIVTEGFVDVTLRKNFLTTIEAGGHFGELALFDNKTRAATVTARTDVRLLTIKQKDFEDILHEDHQLAVKLLWSFLKGVAANMRILSREVVTFSNIINAEGDATLVDFDTPLANVGGGIDKDPPTPD